VQDQRGVRFENADMTGAVFKEVVLVNARISGLIDGLTVNDVEVGPLIGAELDGFDFDLDSQAFVLKWDLRNRTTGQWLSQVWQIPPLAQRITVEDPTSDQLGLEKFYQYTGGSTGAGPISIAGMSSTSPASGNCRFTSKIAL